MIHLHTPHSLILSIYKFLFYSLHEKKEFVISDGSFDRDKILMWIKWIIFAFHIILSTFLLAPTHMRL